MYKKNDERMYISLIDGIKKINSEKKSIIGSCEYKTGLSISAKKQKLKAEGMKGFIGIIKDYIKFKKGKEYSMAPAMLDNKTYGFSNYFLNERIAVYTCITGGYDSVVEPLFIPDNCDYYAVTDFPIPPSSRWKRIDISSVIMPKSDKVLVSSSPVLANRYFKMKPHILFSNYKFSVYVDGNIRICTDMTEYINRLSSVGIGTFRHAQRQCVYEEAEACVAMGKETRESIDKHIIHLKDSGMPRNYGMAQCSVIAREHNLSSCKNLMDEWWDEFIHFAKRDQLSLPLVMFKHNISMDMITTLGANVYGDNSFEIVKHK